MALSARVVHAGVCAAVLGAAPAQAETTLELDGAVNLSYMQQTGLTTTDRFLADVRPGLVLQTASPRLAWRFGYVFGGTLDEAGTNSYSNHADASLVAQLTPRSFLTLGANVTQGGTAFQLSQRAADAGQPALRAPGNPDLVTAGLSESLAWEAGPQLRLIQGVASLWNAPQDDLGRFGASVTASVALDRVFPRDAVGAELRSSVALLQPIDSESAYVSIASALVGRWTRDLGRSWSGLLTAGVQQVLTLAESYPLAFLPTGGLNLQYLSGHVVSALSYSYGAVSDLQTGTVAATHDIRVRESLSFDPLRPRTLSASVGFLHSEPIGQASARVAAGTGDAVQADLGLSWDLSQSVLGTVRYSLAYQFDQPIGLPASLAHVVLLGVTARYSNVRFMRPLPAVNGQRVDGTDATGFSDGSPR
jgi:hypothetical protein